jgi:hypothetical protein
MSDYIAKFINLEKSKRNDIHFIMDGVASSQCNFHHVRNQFSSKNIELQHVTVQTLMINL